MGGSTTGLDLITTCTGQESTHDRMGGCTRGSIKMTRRMALECIYEQMGGNTKEGGSAGSSMEKGSMKCQIRLREEAFGNMGKGLNELIIILLFPSDTELYCFDSLSQNGKKFR